MNNISSNWTFTVDRGGTFTDVIGCDDKGHYHTAKLLSASTQYKDPSIEGIKRILGVNSQESLPENRINSIRFGTTVATNALLERKGCKTALVITKGFRDLLEIGNQARPKIFELNIHKPSIVYDEVFELTERINSSGEILTPFSLSEIALIAEEIKNKSFDSVAVVLLHSWKNSVHELEIEKYFRNSGLKRVYLSHKTINLIKVVTRGQSTLMDAYLSLILSRYMDGIKSQTGSIPIEFMQSSGNVCKPKNFMGKDALLSGPAGGVVAISHIRNLLDINGIIGFDMGGTSTDVSRYSGIFEKVYEQTIAGIELQKESLNITTVASGGGSLLWFDGQKIKVGPESAGAMPGPSCYGFGGPLTITDANLLTGRLVTKFFPKTFGKDRQSGLEQQIVARKFKKLAGEISSLTNESISPEDLALGFIRIANEKMALAIREISVAKGYDVRNHALLCFGGAGGQHACAIAKLLDIKQVIFHPLSSLMSAYGIGLASPKHKTEKTVLLDLSQKNYIEVQQILSEMEKNLLDKVNLNVENCSIKKEIDLRPKGTDSILTIPLQEYKNLVESFEKMYTKVYGFLYHHKSIEIVNIKVNIEDKKESLCDYVYKTNSYQEIIVDHFVDTYYPEGIQSVPVIRRETIPPEKIITGPAFLVDDYSTLFIEKEFEGKALHNGIIILQSKLVKKVELSLDLGKPDPILLEVFNNTFIAIATEMGHSLKNTAYSVNIKERLDFSCAIFDQDGDLVANAPHLPVHLGSMSDTVKAVLEKHGENIKPGNVYVTNNPYHGGSHLPDVTVVKPVFDTSGKIVFFTAARGHHADIGGITPGSMPSNANHIDQEGVLIDNIILVEQNEFREKAIQDVLLNHQYPVRNIKERINDLKSQVASCNRGEKGLLEVIDRQGLDVVKAYMKFIQENAAFCVKQALHKFLVDGKQFNARFEDYLDDGSLIKVEVTILPGDHPPESIRAIIDFTGTSSEHFDDNLNTPLPVTRSAILYVLRCLTDIEIPLSSGCLEPVEIIVPEGSLLNPHYPRPVASGNVETSQRIVDVLLGALKVVAASQGTMNNFLFQVEGDVPYYETIAGGAGAMHGFNGASGVQVHMTNTRITDPEILEFRHPLVFLNQFTLRKNSGGKGLYSGGDGVLREIKFLAPAKVSIISERRKSSPYALEGGQEGQKGENYLCKSTGEKLKLNNRESISLNSNDSILIQTPGGGGFGDS